MANKKGKQGPNPIKTTPAVKPQVAQKTSTTNKQISGNIENISFIQRYAEPLIVAGIALFTYLFLKSGLNNQFTNWDDNGYITNDRFIKDISAEGIKAIFSTDNPVMGNYHPLTILSYAIEYSYKGLEPWIYHFDSLVFHILTTIAVYIFIKLLSRRTVAAAVTALLFGIHPMHVESVAWAAGRKDVIYGFFYMLSCISYIYYLRAAGSKKIGWYISMLVLFVFSLLAKPVAVTLPIVLFAIDYFEKRTVLIPLSMFSLNFSKFKLLLKKTNKWALLDKIIPLSLSIAFGLLSVQAQKKFGAYNNLDIHFTQFEQILLGAYALCTYLWKAILPIRLCNYYPYPLPADITGARSVEFFGCLFIVLALIAVVVLFARKNKVVLFGIAFFLINIVLLLQFVPVGSAILADRYSYLPYIGLFFILAWYIADFMEVDRLRRYRTIVIAVVSIYCIALGFMSSERCKVWYNSITLWRNEVEEHPESPNAYNNLGAIYSDMMPAAQTPQDREKDYDSSLYYLQSAIAIKPDFINSIICLGILQRSHNAPGEIDLAKKTMLSAEKIDDKNPEVYLELGVIYSIKHIYDSAEYCFRRAITIKPFFPEAHSNFANFYDITGKLDSSLKEYAVAIQQNPDAYIPYLNRARIYTRQNKLDDAMKDFAMAVQKAPEMAEIYYSRSQCYNRMGNKALALQDVNKAISLGYTQVDQNYYKSLK